MSEEQDKSAPKEQPIIIKKKRGHGGHGHHGGSWKVAYADFVTAMMAFFIVMWILGQSEDVKKSVVSYFKEPGAYSFITGKRTVPIDLGLQPMGPGTEDYESKGGEGDSKESFSFFAPQEYWDSLAKAKGIDVKTAAEQAMQKAKSDSALAAERVAKLGEEIKKFLKEEMSNRPELKEILSAIKIEMTKEGLRIELLETKDALFFEVGSAVVKPKAREILEKLAAEFGKLPNNIDIEGHTDSRQYSGGARYDNWNLSTDRANASRLILENSGLWEGQVTKVVGYADRKLRNPDNPFDISNRRISLLVRQLSVKDLIQNYAQGNEANTNGK